MTKPCPHNQYSHCVWCAEETMAPEVIPYAPKRNRKGSQEHFIGCWKVHGGCSQYCKRGHERNEKNITITKDKRTGGTRMSCKPCKVITTDRLRERQRKDPLL